MVLWCFLGSSAVLGHSFLGLHFSLQKENPWGGHLEKALVKSVSFVFQTWLSLVWFFFEDGFHGFRSNFSLRPHLTLSRFNKIHSAFLSARRNCLLARINLHTMSNQFAGHQKPASQWECLNSKGLQSLGIDDKPLITQPLEYSVTCQRKLRQRTALRREMVQA